MYSDKDWGILMVKVFYKSVHVCQRYEETPLSVLFLNSRCSLVFCLIPLTLVLIHKITWSTLPDMASTIAMNNTTLATHFMSISSISNCNTPQYHSTKGVHLFQRWINRASTVVTAIRPHMTFVSHVSATCCDVLGRETNVADERPNGRMTSR